ncbi:uncharacterized protein LOC132725706 [Ruditapes philippinarum]|uniref:uncharacterized protein LOC132725706 n=1 Tax=Ruditapes philippinarum TaxID=129788 RepID=UPI00295B213A|nr:uncharacterized protein LOC132725706 [Ruditapes philippinarum]
MGSRCCRENKDKLEVDEGVSHNNAKRPTSPSEVTVADKTHERCLYKEKMYKNEVKKLEKQLMDLEKLTIDKDKEIITLTENHNQQMEEHILKCLYKEKMYKNEEKRLEKQLMDLEKLTIDKDKEIITLKENHYQQMEEQILKHEYERNALDRNISKQREQNRELREENDTLLTRFSDVASAKLTDGNPNIADLSDKNRPTKLAEQYSELYDNEWTDAFGVLKGGNSEENACRILLHMFCDIYIACIKKAGQDCDNVTDAIKTFLDGQQPPVELLKQLKDNRKNNTAGQKTIIKQEIKGKIKCILPEKELRKDQHVKRFFKQWYSFVALAVQIPKPSCCANMIGLMNCMIVLVTSLYKTRIYIAYIVWPVLYLHENGNILMKGIAQCKAKNSKHSSVHSLTSTKPKTGMSYNNLI